MPANHITQSTILFLFHLFKHDKLVFNSKHVMFHILFLSKKIVYLAAWWEKKRTFPYTVHSKKKIKNRPLYCVNKKGFSILIFHRCSTHILNFIVLCFRVKINDHKLTSTFFLYWYFSYSYEFLLNTFNLDIVVLNEYIHNNPILQYKLHHAPNTIFH